MPTPERRIIIIGAGIGGLCTAIGLQRAGYPVTVWESAGALHPVGAGLTIQPNALLALRQLDLAGPIESAAAHLRAGGLMRADGRKLTRLTLEASSEIERELGAGILGIHRATLHERLVAALAPGSLRLGRRCSGFTQTADAVRVHFTDGSEDVGAALIGADGLHSSVRKTLLADGPPRYAGYTSWRGVTERRGIVPEGFGTEMWGWGQRFGGCCIDGDRVYWFAVANAPEGHTDPTPTHAKSRLLARFAGWGGPVIGLLRATPERAILRTDIYDRPAAARWGQGRVTLIGDAAHPMTPNLGQGACQAIEDALALSQAVERHASLQDALRAYERARRSRAEKVVVGARRIGAIAQWQNPIACALRDGLFGLVPESVTKRQLLEAWRLPRYSLG